MYFFFCNTYNIRNVLRCPLGPGSFYFKGEYVYGKRDLFAAMIAFKLTLSKNDFRRLVKEVDIAYKNFFSRAKIITEEMLFSSTGFPSDWKKKLLIDLSK